MGHSKQCVVAVELKALVDLRSRRVEFVQTFVDLRDSRISEDREHRQVIGDNLELVNRVGRLQDALGEGLGRVDGSDTGGSSGRGVEGGIYGEALTYVKGLGL